MVKNNNKEINELHSCLNYLAFSGTFWSKSPSQEIDQIVLKMENKQILLELILTHQSLSLEHRSS
jgi:hypothetical protein